MDISSLKFGIFKNVSMIHLHAFADKVPPFAVQAPFEGVKHSGLGRESNKYGLEDCLPDE